MRNMSACHLPVADSGAERPNAHLGHMMFCIFMLASLLFWIADSTCICCMFCSTSFAGDTCHLHACLCAGSQIKIVALQLPQSHRKQATRSACVGWHLGIVTMTAVHVVPSVRKAHQKAAVWEDWMSCCRFSCVYCVMQVFKRCLSVCLVRRAWSGMTSLASWRRTTSGMWRFTKPHIRLDAILQRLPS